MKPEETVAVFRVPTVLANEQLEKQCGSVADLIELHLYICDFRFERINAPYRNSNSSSSVTVIELRFGGG